MRIRKKLFGLLLVLACLWTGPSAKAASLVEPASAFVQGERLTVFLPLGDGTEQALFQTGGRQFPAARGVQSLAESGMPVTYYLLVDTSTSMRGAREDIRAFAESLAEQSGEGAGFGLLLFGDSFSAVLEPTEDSGAFLSALDDTAFDAQRTDLLRGILNGIEYVSSAERATGGLTGLIVISDGVPDGADGGPDAEEVRQRISDAQETVIHTLWINSGLAGAPQGRDLLASIGSGAHPCIEKSGGTRDAAAEIAGYTDGLSAVSFLLETEPSTPVSGDLFFQSAEEDGGQLLYYAKLADIPVLLAQEDFAPAAPSALPAPQGSQPSSPDPSSVVSAVPESQDSAKVWAYCMGIAAALLAAACTAAVFYKKHRRQTPGTHGIYMRLETGAGKYAGKKTEFFLTDELTIGRSRKCDLVWKDRMTSPVHARVFLRDGLIFLEDLGSETGTFLGGMRIYQKNRLRSGDEISIGRSSFRLRF